MDWKLAMTLQMTALLRLVAKLCAAVEESISESGTMPRHLRLTILRILRPAEAAYRRLLAVHARGMAVPGYVPRPAPDAPIPRGGTGASRIAAFPLFDPRLCPGKQRPRRAAGAGPRLYFFDADETGPAAPPPDPAPDDPVDAERLAARLATLRNALCSLPEQAQRMLRAQARFVYRGSPKRFGVMRPGRPPGHHAKSTHPVDEILRECQMLALWARQPKPPD